MSHLKQRSSNRVGENNKLYFRNDERYFSVNGNWFFSTREKPANGPYSYKQQAVEACERELHFSGRAANFSLSLV